MSEYLALLGSGARSAAERLTVGLFVSAGLEGWVANYPTLGFVIDFAFPEQMLAVEIDGFAYHRDALVRC